jgi:SAM-dependent methyltransferase
MRQLDGEPVTILDVGGTVGFWINMLGPSSSWRVIVLNRRHTNETRPGYISIVTGDACALPFRDQSLAVVFSNSVIEHVGGWPDQVRMADEIARVGRHYFVQTPNRYFPIEPHFLFPGFQFLPEWLRVALHERFALGWYPKAPNRRAAIAQVREIRLLTAVEFNAAFPRAQIHRERLLGLTKSLMASGGWHPASPQSRAQ